MAAGGLLLDEPDEEPDEEPVEEVELSDFAGLLDAAESALASDVVFSAGLSEVALAGRLSFL